MLTISVGTNLKKPNTELSEHRKPEHRTFRTFGQILRTEPELQKPNTELLIVPSANR